MVHRLNLNRHNCVKTNPEKSYLVTNSTQGIQINIGGMVTSSSKCGKLLGIHIDSSFSFPYKKITDQRISDTLKK